MTTTVTVQVPEGATYDVEVVIANETNSPSGRLMKVGPGESLSTYIYGNVMVTSIREVHRTSP